MLGSGKVTLISREIIFLEFQPIWSRYFNVKSGFVGASARGPAFSWVHIASCAASSVKRRIFWYHRCAIPLSAITPRRLVSSSDRNLGEDFDISAKCSVTNRNKKLRYSLAVPVYVPSERSLYFSAPESTVKLSYSAYAVFPSKSAKSTRSRWRLSYVSKWRLSLPAHNSKAALTLCRTSYVHMRMRCNQACWFPHSDWIRDDVSVRRDDSNIL